MKKWVTQNLEIALSLLGLIIIAIIALLFTDSDFDVWIVVGIASIATSLINAIVLWYIRRRQNAIRLETISEIREMLKDSATNTLATISLNTQLSKSMEANRREKVMKSIDKIDQMLDNLSETSLDIWKQRYDIS